jgi:hypothetical protein
MKKEMIETTSTKLQYTVLPESVYYTRDERNPSVVVLTIGGSNTTDTDILVEVFEIQLPVNSDVKNADAITADPSSIIPVSLQPLSWDFQQVDDGLYRASPLNEGTVVKAGQSITFQLQGVTINEAAGTCILVITERSEDINSVNKTIVKTKSKLEITTFTATPDHLSSGEPSVLAWTTNAAARVTLSPGNWPNIKVNDSVTVNPGTTHVYTLTAYGEGPNVSQQRTVFINPPEIVHFAPSSSKLNAGDDVVLSWEVNNADEISISPGDHKNLQPKGSLSVKVITETNFILTAINKGNDIRNKTAAVSINPVLIKSFRANPSYGARLGEPVVLSWEVESAVSALVQYGTVNGITQGSLNTGTQSIIPNTGVAYTLIAQNSLGTAMSSLQLLPMPLGWHQFTASAPFKFPEPPLVLNFKNNIWAMASSLMNAVYYSFDGDSWVTATNTIPWQPRSYSAGTVFKGRMWLMGGKTPTGSTLNDVWSSIDGITWVQAKAAPWMARSSFGCFVLPGTAKMYIIGGLDASGNALADVWGTEDGENWTQVTAQAFQNGRSAFGTVTYNGRAWVLAGKVGGNVVNEVWSSADGASWDMQGNIRWAARCYPVVGALSNGIYLSGGLDESNNGIFDMNKMGSDGKWSVQSGFKMPNVRNTGGVEYQQSLWFIGGAQTGGTLANQNVWAYSPSLK